MNEQMKSKLHKLADTCKHPDNYHQGPWMDYIQFAELIVQECARVANDSNQSKNRAVGVSVGDVVREHFGVEE